MEKITNLVGVFILFSILALSSIPIASAQGYTVTELWSNPMTVNDVAVSADGNYVVAVNDTGVYFFSRDSSQPRWWYTGDGGYFESVAISANGEYVVAGYTNTSNFGFLYYFKDSTTTFNGRGYTWKSVSYPAAIDSPRLVAISDNGTFVVAAANNGTGKYTFLKYFNDSTVRFGSSETETWNLWTLGALASSLDISADGNYVAEGGSDPPPPTGWVSFFKDSSTNPQGWVNDNLLPITDVALSDDGYAVAAVSPITPDTLYYWKDAKNLPSDSPANWTNLLGYGCVDMSSDGDKVVAGTPMIFVCGVHLWDAARTRTGTNETESWNRFAGQWIPDIAISRDGMIIAATAVNVTDDLGSWTYFLTSSGGLIGQFPTDGAGMVVSTSADGGTTAVATSSLRFTTVYVYGITRMAAVGGEILGLNELELLTPYLAMVLLLAGTTVILLKRRKL